MYDDLSTAQHIYEKSLHMCRRVSRLSEPVSLEMVAVHPSCTIATTETMVKA